MLISEPLPLVRAYLELHNNLSERDIREYVKKRKISGSTRSHCAARRQTERHSQPSTSTAILYCA